MAADTVGEPIVKLTDWMKSRTVGVWTPLIRAEHVDIVEQGVVEHIQFGALHGERFKYAKKGVWAGPGDSGLKQRKRYHGRPTCDACLPHRQTYMKEDRGKRKD